MLGIFVQSSSSGTPYIRYAVMISVCIKSCKTAPLSYEPSSLFGKGMDEWATHGKIGNADDPTLLAVPVACRVLPCSTAVV